MNILCLVRPYPAWDRLRFNLATGAVEVPDDSPTGIAAFGEGTWVHNPSDRAALDAAVSLLERSAVSNQSAVGQSSALDAVGQSSALDNGLTVVALATAEPGAAEAALREALARGAVRATLITGAEDADAALATGALAALIRRLPAAEAPALVVLGASAPNGAPDEIGPMLAAELGWGQVTAALTLDLAPGGAPGVQATQAWVGGRRTVVAELPLVVSCLPNPAQPVRYPRPAAILAAHRAASIATQTLGTLDPPGDRAPRVVVRRAALAEAAPAERLAGPLDESVAVLLQALRQRL